MTSDKFTFIISFIKTILILCLIIIAYFVQKKLSNENAILRNEVIQFKKLTEILVRSSNKWVTANDLEFQVKNFLGKKDLAVLKSDLNKLNSNLIAVGLSVGMINKKVSKIEKSDREGPENQNVKRCNDGRLIDIFEYTKNPQIKKVKDFNEAPIANVQFDASNEKPWSYEVFSRSHKLVTIIGRKESGQLTFHHKLEYSIPSDNVKKWYFIDLNSSNYIQAKLKNRMFWFNPILDFNFFAGGRIFSFVNNGNQVSIGMDIGLSLSSYGETNIDSLFRLLRIGAGYNARSQCAHFSFAPFAFNSGKFLPLLTNLYLTPQLAIDTTGGLTLNLGIGPQL